MGRDTTRRSGHSDVFACFWPVGEEFPTLAPYLGHFLSREEARRSFNAWAAQTDASCGGTQAPVGTAQGEGHGGEWKDCEQILAFVEACLGGGCPGSVPEEATEGLETETADGSTWTLDDLHAALEEGK